MINTIQVLDHGFVKLRNIAGPTRRPEDDFDGNDVDPANSARMSFDQMDEDRTYDDEMKLSRYLMKNQHSTPFESIVVWLEFKVPIFVARQMHRHRTCLTGDTVVSFHLPGGKVDGSVRHHPVTLERLCRNWNTGAPMTDRLGVTRDIPQKDRISKMQLRCYDEKRGEITHSTVTDVWCVGDQPVYKVQFNDGSYLTATKDHKVFTSEGWVTVQTLVDQGLSAYRASNSKGKGKPEFPALLEDSEQWKPVTGFVGKYEVSDLGRVRSLLTTQNSKMETPRVKTMTVTPYGYHVVSLSDQSKSRARLVHHLVLDAFIGARQEGQECRHLNSNSLDNRLVNLTWGSKVENMSDRYTTGAAPGLCLVDKQVVGVTFDGIQKVYDMEVDSHHNFFANNTLVHNCTINESSARYIQLPAEWYIPNVVAAAPTGGAKQGRKDSLPLATQTEFKEVLNNACKESYEAYQYFLKMDVAKEQARMFLHVNHYVHFAWQQNLRNLFHFLSLRDHNHAQWESRQFAKAVITLLEPHLPGLMGLYDELRREK